MGVMKKPVFTDEQNRITELAKAHVYRAAIETHGVNPKVVA
jgi:hypothetical protein